MRLPLALCIIMIHLHMEPSSTAIGWGSFGSLDVWRIFACVSINEVASVAVPLFFMISGYLFFVGGKWNGTVFTGKLRRRIHSLLVPYVLFCLLAAVGLVVNYVISGHTWGQSIHLYLGDGKWLHNFWDVHTTGTNTNLLGISKPISYPVNIPLWFIRDLMVIVLMTPLIHLAIRWLRWGWLLLMLAFSISGVWIPLVGFSPSSVLWFSVGAWFSINGRSMAAAFGRWRTPLICAVLPLMVLDILSDGTPADRYVHFAFLLMAVPAVYGRKTTEPTPSTSIKGRDASDVGGGIVFSNSAALSFFIFAFHTLPLPLLGCRPVEWAKQLLWSGSDNGLLCIVQFVAATLLTAAVSIVAYCLLLWLCPGVLRVLTGRASV